MIQGKEKMSKLRGHPHGYTFPGLHTLFDETYNRGKSKNGLANKSRHYILIAIKLLTGRSKH